MSNWSIATGEDERYRHQVSTGLLVSWPDVACHVFGAWYWHELYGSAANTVRYETQVRVRYEYWGTAGRDRTGGNEVQREGSMRDMAMGLSSALLWVSSGIDRLGDQLSPLVLDRRERSIHYRLGSC